MFNVCGVGEDYRYRESLYFLDRATVTSVTAAIRGLTDGSIPCDRACCVVFSSSQRAVILISRVGNCAGSGGARRETKHRWVS